MCALFAFQDEKPAFRAKAKTKFDYRDIIMGEVVIYLWKK